MCHICSDSPFLNSVTELGEKIGSMLASKFSRNMSELANNILSDY